MFLTGIQAIDFELYKYQRMKHEGARQFCSLKGMSLPERSHFLILLIDAKYEDFRQKLNFTTVWLKGKCAWKDSNGR